MEAKLWAFDGQAYDQAGASVAISGDTAIVGARFADGPAMLAGAAYVFERAGGTWTQGPKLEASDGALLDEFGSSVAIAGDLAAIGATSADGVQPAAGAVYLFERIGSEWLETAKLVAPDGQSFDAFGAAVAISGGRVVVGSLYGDGAQSDTGSAYVFENIKGAWMPVGYLAASDGAPMTEFGVSLAADGAVVVVGAWLDGAVGQRAGAAYVFNIVQGAWTQVAKLAAANGAAGDRFGYSVALRQGRIAVGAYFHEGPDAVTGSAYVFELSGGAWVEAAELTAFDGQEFDRFGVSVATSGERVVVGANADDDADDDAGAAYVFDRIGGAWMLVAKLAANDAGSGHLFGSSVALEAATVLAGSPFDPDIAEAAGSAHVFEVPDAVLILQPPTGARALLNTSVTLAVAAAGHGPLSYQWQKGNQDLEDGGAVSGARTPTLTINPVAHSDSDQYRVIVANASCTVVSDRVTLEVVGAPGDLDVDGDLDLDDLAVFVSCLGGVNADAAGECAEADFDGDDDVDLADYRGAQLIYSPPGPVGDLDGDGDVDLEDHAFLADCLTGPDGGVPAGCEPADLDVDGDVDLADFARIAASIEPPPPPPGDLDGDGDVDLEDHALLADCLTGPDGGVPTGCEPADLDLDDDVDLADFARFAASMTPPSAPPGDLDGDGDVDLDDYGMWAGCLTGPAGESLPMCDLADLDIDQDVDLADFATMQVQFSG